MPSRPARKKLAESLSLELFGFGECFSDQFLCPTCMCAFRVEKDSNRYTAGHIIPEAAGGEEWTILCRTCNSRFGERQDKWFGEYLSVLQNPEGTFFHAKSKSKYITVNGVTISGKVSVSEEDGAIEVFAPINRNPPGKVESIPQGPKLEVQFTPEITKHINEVQVGYITAAYLTWFSLVGYSWAMQSSLESVRKQILECDYTLGGAKVVALMSDEIFEPDIGVVVESDHVYPCCLMYDRMVIFPAPNGAPSPHKVVFSAQHQLHLLNLARMDAPYAVSFEGKILVKPDMLRKEPPVPEHLLYIFADSDKEAQWLVLER
ncbi:hypothetical protein F6453_3626 [Marinobacter nauticus]|jgi:HNH endonuclease|uniref:HNH endonuclease 5 domain-containing protein n=2 Tax=Marinobacter nauticus TaxID=2743 RepID=A0A833N8F6_MARNT|nr:hypothetical protein F6453_3626 [Marinobacter nauticus]